MGHRSRGGGVRDHRLSAADAAAGIVDAPRHGLCLHVRLPARACRAAVRSFSRRPFRHPQRTETLLSTGPISSCAPRRRTGKLTDILGARFAFTTEDSQSGYHAPRTLLAPYASERGGALFASVIGPLITPRRVVDAVLEGTADAGPLDSYAHELLRAHEPALAARLRTIASTSPTPIPPLVAAPGIAPAVAQRLRSALLAAGHAPELAPLLTALRLAGFAAIDARRYDELRRRARAADAQGYPRLA